MMEVQKEALSNPYADAIGLAPIPIPEVPKPEKYNPPQIKWESYSTPPKMVDPDLRAQDILNNINAPFQNATHLNPTPNFWDFKNSIYSEISDFPASKLFFIVATIVLIVFAIPLWKKLKAS
jgi:hypothetical protein